MLKICGTSVIVQEFIIHGQPWADKREGGQSERRWVEAWGSVQRTLISIFCGGQMNRHGCFSSHQSPVSMIRSRSRTRGTDVAVRYTERSPVWRRLGLNGCDSQTRWSVGARKWVSLLLLAWRAQLWLRIQKEKLCSLNQSVEVRAARPVVCNRHWRWMRYLLILRGLYV